VIDGLPDVMKQADALGDLLVKAEFGGHDAFDFGDFDRMIEHILREAMTEF